MFCFPPNRPLLMRSSHKIFFVATVLAVLPAPASALELVPENNEWEQSIQGWTAQKWHKELQYQALQIRQLEERLLKQQQVINRNGHTITNVDGGIRVYDTENGNSFRLGGRLHIDAATYSEDGREGDSDGFTRLGDGLEVRRARLFVSGTFQKDWKYRVEYDFSDDSVSLTTAWLGRSIARNTSFRIGQLLVPFSLEQSTSSNNITFMERALPNTLAPRYSLGLGVSHYATDWTVSTGLFSEPAGDRRDDRVDDGWRISGRFTTVLLRHNSLLFHLGASAEYREPDDDKEVRFRSTPESHVAESRDLVDTGRISHLGSLRRYGAEAVVQAGPTMVQTEYLVANVQREGAQSLRFPGWYVSASWQFGGRTRKYRRGGFGGVRTVGETSAWELALRLSHLDLEDEEITGGRERNLTLGLNWYTTSHLRFMLNYIRASGKPNDNGMHEAIDILQGRMQIVF